MKNLLILIIPLIAYLEIYWDWGFKVEGCHIVTDYPDRDPADPKCQDITVVMID